MFPETQVLFPSQVHDVSERCLRAPSSVQIKIFSLNESIQSNNKKQHVRYSLLEMACRHKGILSKHTETNWKLDYNNIIQCYLIQVYL